MALLDRQLEVIDILGQDDSFDGLIELNGLRVGEIRIRLHLVHVGKRAHEKLASVGDARLRPDPYEVITGRHVGCDGKSQFDFIISARLHALNLKAGREKQQVFEVG